MPDFAVILPAAGTSARFGADRDKLLETLEGQSVIARSVHAFLSRRDVVQVIIPTRRPDLLAPELPRDMRLGFCLGGSCRAESVRSGLSMVHENVEWVAVHDAARPLVTQSLIDRTLAAAVERGAAVPAVPVTLTIKQADGPLPSKVERTLPRQSLWTMQTPQIARRSDLDDAFEHAPTPLNQITDDVQLIELAGKDVWLIEGDERNIKITTPLDLKLAHFILSGGADVIPLFLSLTIFNLLCLSITAALGYGVMMRGEVFAPYHQLAGVLSTVACCAVHCIVFTYFIATAKWAQHAIDVKRLNPTLASPTRSFKAQAFPAAIIAMMVVFLAAVFGVLRLSYGIAAIWHHAIALLAIAINVGVSAIEYRAIVRNGRLIDSILARINAGV